MKRQAVYVGDGFYVAQITAGGYGVPVYLQFLSAERIRLELQNRFSTYSMLLIMSPIYISFFCPNFFSNFSAIISRLSSNNASARSRIADGMP